jgi:hypothetical protein
VEISGPEITTGFSSVFTGVAFFAVDFLVK